MKRTHVLPVYLAKEHVSDLCITLPLCVILANPKLIPWYYENLVNICFTNREKSLCFSEYSFNFMGYYNNLFRYSEIVPSMINSTNICEYITRHLVEENYYCYIVLDEYYLSCKKHFQKQHFFHQSLIYGFNKDDRKFFAITLNEKDLLDCVEFDYCEVEKAFNIDKENCSICFFKPWHYKSQYEFSIQRFCKHLEDYINSTSDYTSHFIACSIFDSPREYYGIEAIKKCICCFSDTWGLDYYDFRNIHFLYEHKCSVKKKIEYLYNNGYLKPSMRYLIDDFNTVCKQYAILRKFALKCILSRSIPSRRKVKTLIQKQITCLIDDELKIIRKLLKNISISNTNPTQFYGQLKEVDNALHNDVLYKNHKRIEYMWDYEKHVSSITIPQIGAVSITLDGTEPIELFSSNCSYRDYHHVAIDKTTKHITIDLFSDVNIDENIFPILNVCSLTHLKNFTFSSLWKETETEPTFDKFSDLTYNNYWRAAEQRGTYDGSDWLEINFDDNTAINTIIIGELEYSQRLKKYRILYMNNSTNMKELLVHNFVKGKLQIHTFPTIIAQKLKIEFLECDVESNGFCEPILSTFNVYFIE